MLIYNVIKYRKMGYANNMGNDYIVHPHAGAIIRLYITVIVINSIYIIYYTICICTYICYMVDKYHDKNIHPIISQPNIHHNTSTSTSDSDNDNVIRNTGGDDSVV